MGQNIPHVRRWLVNYWRDGKVVASDKVDAPTKFLAALNIRFDYAHWKRIPDGGWDKRTITPIRKAG